jgi:hypothetical protein
MVAGLQEPLWYRWRLEAELLEVRLFDGRRHYAFQLACFEIEDDD